jgi:hypothetical protein
MSLSGLRATFGSRKLLAVLQCGNVHLTTPWNWEVSSPTDKPFFLVCDRLTNWVLQFTCLMLKTDQYLRFVSFCWFTTHLSSVQHLILLVESPYFAGSNREIFGHPQSATKAVLVLRIVLQQHLPHPSGSIHLDAPYIGGIMGEGNLDKWMLSKFVIQNDG